MQMEEVRVLIGAERIFRKSEKQLNSRAQRPAMHLGIGTSLATSSDERCRLGSWRCNCAVKWLGKSRSIYVE